MYCEYQLSGICQSELNTEIRFDIADARQDGHEIIKLYFPLGDNDRENQRITHCMIKVLRSVMHGGAIEYFTEDRNLESGSTEAEFLLNKYGEHLSANTPGFKCFYVKI